MPGLLQPQKLILRAHVLTNTTTLAFSGGNLQIGTVFAAPSLSGGDATIIADWYSALASPTYNIYRQSVPMGEIMLNGFDWTRVDNLSVGKARIWEWLFDAGAQRIDPSKPNVRAGINAVWVGTAQDLAVRAAVYDHCYTAARRVEQVFAVVAGTVPAADGSGPGVPDFIGFVNANDIQDIKGLPA